LIANDKIDQTPLFLGGSFRKAGQPPSRGSHPHRCKDHSRQADVAREAQASIRLGRKIEPGQGLAGQFAAGGYP
jgi:hypothetical protein